MNKALALSMISALFVSFSAQANETKFSCGSVGGTEEWTIYIDLKKGLAGFFDNNATVTIPLKQTNFIDTMPAQTEYVFEGMDTAGAPGEKLSITFNLTKHQASVTTGIGTRDQETLNAEEKCVADRRVTL